MPLFLLLHFEKLFLANYEFLISILSIGEIYLSRY